MKKHIFFTIAVVLSMAVAAQDSYRKALETYIGSNSDIEGQAQKMLPILKQSMGDTIAEVFSEYMQSQMKSDVADLYEPVFRKYVSEKDLKELSDWNKKERTKQIQNKSLEIISGLSDQNKLFEKMQPYMTGLAALMHGEKPDSIAFPQLPKSYKQQLKQFMDYNRLGEIFDNLMQYLITQTSGLINNEQTKKDVVAYTRSFIDNLTIDLFSQLFSEDELRYMNKQSKSEAAQHVALAQAELMSDPVEYSKKYYEKILVWVEKNHPEYVKKFKQAFKIL